MQPRGGSKRAAPSSNVYNRQVCHRSPGWRSTSKLRRPFAYAAFVDDRAAESAIARWGPFGGNPAAAHDTVRFHLKQIGEVAANRYLKLKAYPPHTVVGDFDILVHAVIDPSLLRRRYA